MCFAGSSCEKSCIHVLVFYLLWRNSIVKALAHYNWNYKKSRYCPYTLQLFFTTAKIFSTVLYMGNDFHNDFFYYKWVYDRDYPVFTILLSKGWVCITRWVCHVVISYCISHLCFDVKTSNSFFFQFRAQVHTCSWKCKDLLLRIIFSTANNLPRHGRYSLLNSAFSAVQFLVGCKHHGMNNHFVNDE